jgi:Carboxypeptidase regulatory-like domain
MSELPQSGRHPDADQLSAFIEHALPEHEYQLALAHLADCPECRTIVSLSLPPVDESPVLQASAARRSLCSGWKFSGWNLAWPAAATAAFAALAVFFAVHIHNTATTRGGSGIAAQLAESHAPVPPAAGEQSPIPTPMAPEHESEQLPRNAHTAKGTQSKDARPPQGRTVTALSQLRPVPSNGSGGTGAAQPHGPVAQTADQLQQNPQRGGNMFTAGRPASEATAPSAVVGGISRTLEVRNDATPPAVLSPITQHPLPSHLPALSMVSTGQRILAIDTRNTLFLSDDAGNHWKTIPSPWEGRAVKVELASSAIPSGQSAVTNNLHPASSFGVAGGLLRSSAQVTSSTLTGTVKDPSGAFIPGASVVVSNSTTMVGGPVKTDSAGRYVVNDLSPGSYQVEVQAPGFEKQQIAVTLTASQQNLADFTLSVGQLAQTVAVEAPASASSPVALKKTAEPPPASESLTRFEITTDTGERWTSTDGQTWMHR